MIPSVGRDDVRPETCDGDRAGTSNATGDGKYSFGGKGVERGRLVSTGVGRVISIEEHGMLCRSAMGFVCWLGARLTEGIGDLKGTKRIEAAWATSRSMIWIRAICYCHYIPFQCVMHR